MNEMKTVKLIVNKREYIFSIGNAFGQIPSNETLVNTLRERLNLTGSKKSCDQGACGCCTVIMNGKAVPSCMILTADCDGKEITTIEGLRKPDGTLHPLQQAFIDEYAFQCGYCTPGIIMTAKALLDEVPDPTREEIEDALAGNYCRCISQYHVFNAIEECIRRGGREE